MISTLAKLADAKATLTANQYDPTTIVQSIGSMGMKRPKRQGRNPSTGARTSTRYGLAMVFDTGIEPLATSKSLPLY